MLPRHDAVGRVEPVGVEAATNVGAASASLQMLLLLMMAEMVIVVEVLLMEAESSERPHILMIFL